MTDTVRWPANAGPSDMIGLALGLKKVFISRSTEPGDDADRAARLATSFVLALRDHERHGRMWLEKHGLELQQFLVALCPELIGVKPLASSSGERIYEGGALVSLALKAFPGSQRGGIGTGQTVYGQEWLKEEN